MFMFKRAKRLALVAVALLAGVGAEAKADTVSFYTVAYFTDAGSTVGAHLGGSTVTDSIGSGSSTLFGSGDAFSVSINGLTHNNQLIKPSGTASGTTFAAFTFNDPNVLTDATLIGSKIEIDIYQTATNPTAGSSVGSGVLVGSATATFVGDPTGGDSVVLQFQGQTKLYIPDASLGFPPTVIYSVSKDPGQLLVGQNGQVLVSGTVAEAPLPATASMGLTLIGACGIAGAGMKLRRKSVLA